MEKQCISKIYPSTNHTHVIISDVDYWCVSGWFCRVSICPYIVSKYVCYIYSNPIYCLLKYSGTVLTGQILIVMDITSFCGQIFLKTSTWLLIDWLLVYYCSSLKTVIQTSCTWIALIPKLTRPRMYCVSFAGHVLNDNFHMVIICIFFQLLRGWCDMYVISMSL